jgi:hypothetical protein
MAFINSPNNRSLSVTPHDFAVAVKARKAFGSSEQNVKPLVGVCPL